ncbi:MAG: hypothetical protein HOM11_13770 [Methylococcales bacterium]|jgi:hypothetical protein|nr:hypothetical protein [Methylococcales bacterium]MBT7444793.1 hypothetical protein [Methylococcales bacterium]
MKLQKTLIFILLTFSQPLLAAESPLFTKYIAIGDSLTQGMQGTSADETRQPDAYPALLANVMSTQYTQAPPSPFLGTVSTTKTS